MLIELKPLQSYPYDATRPQDINDADQTVGFSYVQQGGFSSPRFGPWSQATFWDANGTPMPLVDGPNYSSALRINNSGKVLYYVGEGPMGDGPKNFFVGPVGAAVALELLIPSLGGHVGAVDLNDNDWILGWRETVDGPAQNFLYDLSTGNLIVLPALGNQYVRLVGVDNAGRVLGYAYGQESANPVDGRPLELFWLPFGGSYWNFTGMLTYGLLPQFSKSGLVLASISHVNPSYAPYSNQVASYMDLNAAHPVVKSLPRLYPTHTNLYASYAYDANAAGVIVGHDDLFNGPATSFKEATGQVKDLSSYFGQGWKTYSATAINNGGSIVGTGGIHIYTPQYQPRGWVINPDRDTRFDDLSKRFSESVRVLIGILGGGGGYVLPVGGPPRPIGPEGWISALSPERRDAVIGMLIGALSGTLSDEHAIREMRGIERQLLQKAIDALRR